MKRTKKIIIACVAGAMMIIGGLMLFQSMAGFSQATTEGIAAADTLTTIESLLGDSIVEAVEDSSLVNPIITADEGDILGMVEVPECGVKTALKYGTSSKENLVDGACVTNYSTPDRLFILGHNYGSMAKNRIFSGLTESKEGQEVILSFLKKEGSKKVRRTYTYRIEFSKQYTEEAFYADNCKLFADNADYGESYDLALATCNHYADGTRGRQVVLCNLVSAA